MPDALVKLNQIKKLFGTVRALTNINLEVTSGLITAIVGDNGSGKSTLIKLLSGNLMPDSGTIVVSGTAYHGLTIRQSLALGIRTVYQDLSLDDRKNSSENVFLGCERMRGPFLDRHAMEVETQSLLDRLEIQIPNLRMPVQYLSGGQRQGLAIARALRSPGKILLLDEPTAAMGIRESGNTLELLRRLRRDGMTQVLISHNLYQVFDVADRVFVIREGHCIADVMTAASSPNAIHQLILEREQEAAF